MAGAPGYARFSSILGRSNHVLFRMREEASIRETCSQHGESGGVGYLFTHQPRVADLIRSPANRMFVDRDHVGQAFGALRGLSDRRLQELLPTHGFPVDAIRRVRDDDRAGLMEARLETLIHGEREFMEKRRVVPPTVRTAATVADSDVSDDQNTEIDPGDGDTFPV